MQEWDRGNPNKRTCAVWYMRGRLDKTVPWFASASQASLVSSCAARLFPASSVPGCRSFLSLFSPFPSSCRLCSLFFASVLLFSPFLIPSHLCDASPVLPWLPILSYHLLSFFVRFSMLLTRFPYLRLLAPIFSCRVSFLAFAGHLFQTTVRFTFILSFPAVSSLADSRRLISIMTFVFHLVDAWVGSRRRSFHTMTATSSTTIMTAIRIALSSSG